MYQKIKDDFLLIVQMTSLSSYMVKSMGALEAYLSINIVTFFVICETQPHRYDPTWPLIFCVILIHSHQTSKFYDRHITIVRTFTRNGLDIFIGSILKRILEGPYLCMWSSFDQLYSCWGLLRGVCNRTHVLTRLMRNIII